MIRSLISRMQIDSIVRLWCVMYYKAALRQIKPLHPDVPYIVTRLNYWEQCK
jgi:hypothetical protein